MLKLLCSAVSYDTAWTFVYDGGKFSDGKPIEDNFGSILALKDGSCICVGGSLDTSGQAGILFVKLNPTGEMVHKKLIYGNSIYYCWGNTICLLKNKDFIIGGMKTARPWVLRTDSLGEIKWSTTTRYFDFKKKTKNVTRVGG